MLKLPHDQKKLLDNVGQINEKYNGHGFRKKMNWAVETNIHISVT